MPRAAVTPKPAASGLRVNAPTDDPAGQQGRSSFEQAQGLAAAESTRRQLSAVPFLSGVAITGVKMPAGGGIVKVVHGLKRTPKGYLLTRSTGDPRFIWHAWDTSTLLLQNMIGTAYVVDLWVF